MTSPSTTAAKSPTSHYEHELLLTRIEKHPKNPRHRAIADPDMVASVREAGVLEPVLVAPVLDEHGNDTGKVMMIGGHRRLDAAKKAKLKALPAIIRTDLATEGQQLEAMLIENGHREDLTPVEEAEAYHQLELLGYSAVATAAAVGRNVKTVRARLKLVKLSATTKKKLHAGQLTLDDAAAFVEFADDPDATKTLESAAKGDNFKVTLKRVRRDRDAERKIAVDVAKLLDQGATEIPLRKGTSIWQALNREKGPTRLDSTHSNDWGQHKGCLGFIRDPGDMWSAPSLVVVCTNPGSHLGKAPKVTKEERERQKKREQEAAELEAREAAARIASEVRVDSVVDHVGANTAVPQPVADVLRVGIIEVLRGLYGDELEQYQRLMGVLDEDRWDHSNTHQSVDGVKLRGHVTDLCAGPAYALTRALVAALTVQADYNLTNGWRRIDAAAQGYLDFLDEIGHPFSDADVALRDELAAKTPAVA